jgi:hypothetical protein
MMTICTCFAKYLEAMCLLREINAETERLKVYTDRLKMQDDSG